MRKIKFKAWDKELKQMVYDVQATYDGLEYSKANKDIDVDVYDWMDCFESWFNDRRFDLMQYTGLKDKNGVEIYEGDILQLELETYRNIYKEVKDLYEMFVIDNNADRVTIMGNVYETPELLEGLK